MIRSTAELRKPLESHLVMAPRQAVVGQSVQRSEVRRDAHNGVEVERDGEPAEQDRQHRHEVQHDDRQTRGEVGHAGGGVREAVEEVQASIEERTLARPEHLEMTLGPTRTLLEGLLSNIWSFTDGQVLLHSRLAVRSQSNQQQCCSVPGWNTEHAPDTPTCASDREATVLRGATRV